MRFRIHHLAFSFLAFLSFAACMQTSGNFDGQIQSIEDDGIVGGTKATSDNIKPGQVGSSVVSLFMAFHADSDTSQGAYCTGVLIAPDLVLTAAHCFNTSPDHIDVGIHFLRSDGFRSPVLASSWKVHPDFVKGSNTSVDSHDVALIKLKSPAKDVIPALLPSADIDLSRPLNITSIGYGIYHDQGGDFSQKGFLQYVAKTTKGLSADGALIEVDESDHKGPCEGDSGGPAMYQKEDGKWYVLGTFRNADFQVTPEQKAELAGMNNNVEKFLSKHRDIHLCGDVATYINIKNYLNWIQQTAPTLK